MSPVIVINETTFSCLQCPLQMVFMDLKSNAHDDFNEKLCVLAISTKAVDFVIDLTKLAHLVEPELGQELENLLIIAFDFERSVKKIREQLRLNLLAIFDVAVFWQCHMWLWPTPTLEDVIQEVLGQSTENILQGTEKSMLEMANWESRPLSSAEQQNATAQPYLLLLTWRGLLTLFDQKDLQWKGVEPMKHYLMKDRVTSDVDVTFIKEFNTFFGTQHKSVWDMYETFRPPTIEKMVAHWDFRKKVAVAYDINMSKVMSFDRLVNLALEPPTSEAELVERLEEEKHLAGFNILVNKQSRNLLRICENGKDELLRQLRNECFNCLKPGHIREECYVKSSNFLDKRSRYLLGRPQKQRRKPKTLEEKLANKSYSKTRKPKQYEWPVIEKFNYGLMSAMDLALSTEEGTTVPLFPEVEYESSDDDSDPPPAKEQETEKEQVFQSPVDNVVVDIGSLQQIANQANMSSAAATASTSKNPPQ